jgi:putative membrane protein
VPALLLWFSPTVALAGLAALLGGAVLYKGLGIDEYVGRLPEASRELLYSGQMSVVTYVTAVGLTIVGLFSGGLAVTPLAATPVPLSAVVFLHGSSPWLTFAGVTAATGRLLDRLIADEPLPTAMLSLPAGVLAIGIITRGFTGYLLAIGLRVGTLDLAPIYRLAAFVGVGVFVSLLGVRAATALETHQAIRQR